MEAKSDGGLFTAALGNISVMETLLSAEGEGRPTGVSAVPPALHYEADCDTGLTDAAAFTAGMARFTEETTQLAKLVRTCVMRKWQITQCINLFDL